MSEKIRVGIVGYGNLGRGAEMSIKQNPDLELNLVLSRRSPQEIKTLDPNVKVLNISEAENYIEKIDVMLLCGGSATDLPEQGPHFAQMFNTVDSFDNHDDIPEYFAAVDEAAKPKYTSVISTGWDPGLFSLQRMIAESILPEGNEYTFWGAGVSQGHSDAIRRVEGVKYAVQYTIPSKDAINRVRSGEDPKLTTREKHLRDCYVIPEEGTDKEAVEQKIKNMPAYFAEYDTRVTFITEEEMKKNHSGIPHGGFVIRSGKTGIEGETKNKQIYEFSLKLDSNPEFTANVMAAYARAVYRLNQEGKTGAFTVFDVPPSYLSFRTSEYMRKYML